MLKIIGRKSLFGAVALAALAASCATTEPVVVEPVVEAPPEPVFTPTEGLTDRERFRLAANLLNQGLEGQAKAELNELLVSSPESGRAQLLLMSATADPIDLFAERYGAESFPYTVRRGETLSQISQRFLGEGLLFYALAKYNGVEVPGEVPAGLQIQVPGAPAPARVAEAAPEPEATPDIAAAPEPEDDLDADLEEAPLSTAEQVDTLVDKADAADDRQEALSVLRTAQSLDPDNKLVGMRLARLHVAEAEARLPANDFQAARSQIALFDAQRDRFSIRELDGRAAPLRRRVDAGAIYESGVREANAGDYVEAYNLLKRAVATDGDFEAAQAKLAEVEPQAADAMHRQALQSFSGRTLEGLQRSIELWRGVLEIEPDNETAQIRLQEAQSLLQRVGGGGR